MIFRKWISISFCFLATCGLAERLTYYPSGTLSSYETEISVRHLRSEEEIGEQEKKFLASEFKRFIENGFTLKKVRRLSDHTHHHDDFQLFYRNYPVIDGQIKIHVRKGAGIEYASSLLEEILSVNWTEFPVVSSRWRRVLKKRHPDADLSSVQLKKVVWPDAKVRPALEIMFRNKSRTFFATLYLDAFSYEFIDERTNQMHVDVTGCKVYKNSPLGMGSTFDTVTLQSLTANSSLSSSLFNVFRHELGANPLTDAPVLVNVDPRTDYTSLADTYPFSLDPDNYSGDSCKASTSTNCPNQSFEAVNVYYHLYQFRTSIDNYMATLGATTTFSASLFDPLTVIVNYLLSADSNNAFYTNGSCTDVYTGCLVFLMPESGYTTCSGAVAYTKFYSLAREATVIVHEYQHYITDRITRMNAGTVRGKYRVGAALHEGYSDYFAVSQVSELNQTNVTNVGGYAFQECSIAAREIGTLRPMNNSETEADPHISGQTWATGLWQLRSKYGKTTSDLIAYKSLFFLSQKPSFLDAVEALVKADKALFSGSHVGYIRQLFYKDLKVLGGSGATFRDYTNGTVELGFRGCGNVSGRPFQVNLVVMLFLSWIGGLFVCGFRSHCDGSSASRNEKTDE